MFKRPENSPDALARLQHEGLLWLDAYRNDFKSASPETAAALLGAAKTIQSLVNSNVTNDFHHRDAGDTIEIMLQATTLSRLEQRNLLNWAKSLLAIKESAASHGVNLVFDFRVDPFKNKEEDLRKALVYFERFADKVYEAIEEFPEDLLAKARDPISLSLNAVIERYAIYRAPSFAAAQLPSMEDTPNSEELLTAAYGCLVVELATAVDQWGRDLVLPMVDWKKFLYGVHDFSARQEALPNSALENYIDKAGLVQPIPDIDQLMDGLPGDPVVRVEAFKKRLMALGSKKKEFQAPGLQLWAATLVPSSFLDPLEAVALVSSGRATGTKQLIRAHQLKSVLEANFLRTGKWVYYLNADDEWRMRGEEGKIPLRLAIEFIRRVLREDRPEAARLAEVRSTMEKLRYSQDKPADFIDLEKGLAALEARMDMDILNRRVERAYKAIKRGNLSRRETLEQWEIMEAAARSLDVAGLDEDSDREELRRLMRSKVEGYREDAKGILGERWRRAGVGTSAETALTAALRQLKVSSFEVENRVNMHYGKFSVLEETAWERIDQILKANGATYKTSDAIYDLLEAAAENLNSERDEDTVHTSYSFIRSEAPLVRHAPDRKQMMLRSGLLLNSANFLNGLAILVGSLVFYYLGRKVTELFVGGRSRFHFASQA